MKDRLAVFASIAVAAFCWGVYGPVLHEGQVRMGIGGHPSLWLPFICVGLAYFGIAVLVPGILLSVRGEIGRWSSQGAIWSLIAGAAGALGALGIIMAFKNHGNPIYVMPLVFGGAPVVNTFTTMAMNKTYKEAGPLFFAGLILVVAGAVTVLIFKPGGKPGAGPPLTAGDAGLVTLWVAVTALAWGVYGPTLHKGQAAMAGSRLRPLMCVGLAYFLIAVLIPLAIVWQQADRGGVWNAVGTLWSLGGGAAGAIGAIGIIMAFNFGGKPIYVMPLVFGCAPVVNTLVTILSSGGTVADASPVFFAGLILVAVGAVTVLTFAPRSHGKPAPANRPAKPSIEPAKT